MIHHLHDIVAIAEVHVLSAGDFWSRLGTILLYAVVGVVGFGIILLIVMFFDEIVIIVIVLGVLIGGGYALYRYLFAK